MISRRYLVLRSMNALLTYAVALVFIFAIPRLIPGSPEEMMASSYRLPGEVAAVLRARFGLDKSLSEQFLLYVRNVILTFPPDFGISYSYYPAPVWNVVTMYLPWTIFLLALSILLTAIIGILLGILSAWKRGTRLETAISGISMFLLSTPYFWIAMILIMLFGVYIPIFPPAGAYSSRVIYETFFCLEFVVDVLRHAALPVLSLVAGSFASYTIIMRDNMTSTMGEDYVTTAEAKGVETRAVVFRHAARNAVLPILTLFILHIGTMVGGAIVTESVFSYPGVGLLLFNAILNQDYPLVQGFFYVITIMVIVANWVADILYVFVDPRIRY